MPRPQQLLDEIAVSPEGPEIAALFDLDRTLIAGFSAQDILMERVMSRDVTFSQITEGLSSAVEFGLGRIEFVEFVNRSARDLGGRPDAENYEFGQRVFDKRGAQRLYPEARQLVDAHRKRGHTIAVISSATPYQVQPVANDLGIDNVLCTRLEVDDGVCTGKVLEPACFGQGKADAAEVLAGEHGLDLSRSYFYSDGSEDLPLFEIVGKPRPLNPDGKLTDVARQRGWPITRFDSRGTPTAMTMARMGMTFGAVPFAAAAGLANLVLNRSPQEARNLSSTLWGELGSAAIDLKLHVEGEEHLWSHRPAVFVFNHQSALDALAMVRLLRRDFTGVGKKEIKSIPIMGQLFQLAGIIFVDRSNHEQAVAALAPAVDALKDGTSIVIAPEGTRSPTVHLGPFKKGAFHLCMQGEVPMVPVILRNTTEAMPKGALFARPGTIEVVVLPPIDTSDWRPETINDHVAEVRGMFLEVLGQQPD
jgi:putative phosphoserine phosphatase/1-acylglycerol-3-phosphate O-acyltransferase